jgi:hypothetical protein
MSVIQYILDIFTKGEQDMAHFKIKVADLYVDVVARGELTARICRPYLVESAFTDISIYATPEQIKKKIASMPILLTEEQAECICLHENLALKLVYHDAFVLHAALLSYKGKGYAIVAPRGVGKTVHANLWKHRFGDDVTIINGDKPILRRQSDGTYLAYGTPWSGKNDLSSPAGVPVGGIAFVRRGEENSIRRLTVSQALPLFMSQSLWRLSTPEAMDKQLLMADAILRQIPLWELTCRNDDAAAILSHSVMTKG